MGGRRRAPGWLTEAVRSQPLRYLFTLPHLLFALRLCCQWITARCIPAIVALKHEIHSVNFKCLRLWLVIVAFSAATSFPHPLPDGLLQVILEGRLLLVTAQSLNHQWLITVSPETWNYFYFLKNTDKLLFSYMQTDNPCYSFKTYVIQLEQEEGESEGKGCILLENGKYCIYHLKRNKKICKLCGFLWQ